MALLSLCAGAAHGAEIRLGIEGHVSLIRNLPTEAVLLQSSRADLQLRLQGRAYRAHGSLGRSGGRDRFEVRFERFADRDARDRSLFDDRIRLALSGRTTVTGLDLLWSREVTTEDARYALRSQVGYRYLRARQSRDEALTRLSCRDCDATARLRSSLSGHGLRGGFETGIRLAGALRFEAEGGLGLLRASETERRDVLDDSVPEGLRHISLNGHERSIASWDLAARVRVDWRRLTAAAGYRLQTWEGAGRYLESEALGIDGPFVGLTYQFGR